MEEITCPHCSTSVHPIPTCIECGNILPLHKKDLFHLFDISPSFDLDPTELNNKLLEKLYFWHPDKFINATELTKKIATENSALLNYAFKQLSSSLNLAFHLLSLEEIDIESLDSNSVPKDLLMDSFHWREELEKASSTDECNELMDKLIVLKKDNLIELKKAFSDRDLDIAVKCYISLKFIERFINEIDSKMEMLDEAL